MISDQETGTWSESRGKFQEASKPASLETKVTAPAEKNREKAPVSESGRYKGNGCNGDRRIEGYLELITEDFA